MGTKRVKAGTSKKAALRRRTQFVEAYIQNGGNAKQAAIAAGFSQNGAAVTGSQILTDPNVLKAIEIRRSELENTFELTTDRVLRECARIVYADPRKLFDKRGEPIPIPDLDDDTAAVVASVEHVQEFEGEGAERKLVGYTKKIRLWDKNSAIDKAMKHLGLFERDNRQAKTSVLVVALSAEDERL